MVRLCICAGSSEPLLLVDDIKAKTLCLLVLKELSLRDSSFEHPKEMFRPMDEKIIKL